MDARRRQESGEEEEWEKFTLVILTDDQTQRGLSSGDRDWQYLTCNLFTADTEILKELNGTKQTTKLLMVKKINICLISLEFWCFPHFWKRFWTTTWLLSPPPTY